MPTRIWQCKFFKDPEGRVPDRTGYIKANSEDKAAEIALRNLSENENRIEVVRVIFRPELRLEPGLKLLKDSHPSA